jgi:hypothetical protein
MILSVSWILPSSNAAQEFSCAEVGVGVVGTGAVYELSVFAFTRIDRGADTIYISNNAIDYLSLSVR